MRNEKKKETLPWTNLERSVVSRDDGLSSQHQETCNVVRVILQTQKTPSTHYESQPIELNTPFHHPSFAMKDEIIQPDVPPETQHPAFGVSNYKWGHVGFAKG